MDMSGQIQTSLSQALFNGNTLANIRKVCSLIYQR
jgi:hypothetical protein